MKKLYSFLAGIAAIILVLWGIATHLDSKINSRDSQKLVIYNWGDYIVGKFLLQILLPLQFGGDSYYWY